MPTRPGVNPIFDLNHFTLAERQPIMRLARHFYITRAAKAVQMGNSVHRAFLMRPTDGMSAVLNVEREIVTLFANYETFEARTLNAFDRVYGEFDDIRVDRSLRFLISLDQNIENSIQHYLAQNPEYPVVVPLKYSDFRAPNEDFIFNAIRRNYLIRDLFGYQSPLKQEYFFFGRAKLLENVIDLHKSGQNSGLFGLRKSGKTSTIYALQRRAKASDCRTVVIDCQDPAVHARRYASLLELIVSEVRRQLGLKELEIKAGENPAQIAQNFRRLMNDALGTAGCSVLMIFDEIENISPMTAASPHWRNEEDTLLFWQTVRSYFQSPGKHRLTFCFVGTNPHLFEFPKIRDVDNPVYLFAPKTFIPMLSLAETTEMVSRLGYFMGLDFPHTVIAYIHQRFGGHPFFIRQLCSQIHKSTSINRPREISITACKEAEAGSTADTQRYMTEILNTLKAFYPDEHAMIEYLARAEKAKFSDMANYDPAYTEHLVGYGLITRRGDDYEFAFAAVEEVVKKAFRTESKPELSQKWQIINNKRNRIEQEIRGVLYQWAIRLDPVEWGEAWRSCLSEKRSAETGRLTRQEAFSRNSSPLYFIELMKFLAHSAQYDESISEAMNVVNRFRVDAHAKDIDDGEYDALLNALQILETMFVPPP